MKSSKLKTAGMLWKVFAVYLLLASSGAAQAALQVNSRQPNINALNVTRNAVIEVQFNQNINQDTVLPSSFVVRGTQTFPMIGTRVVTGNTITFTPQAAFHPGEVVTVTLTKNIKSTTNEVLAKPFVWQFTVETSGVGGNAPLYFFNTGQTLGNYDSSSVTLADLNNNGKLDAFLGGNGGNAVYTNDGTGVYTVHHEIGNFKTSSARLGDLNGDGNLDVFITLYYSPYSVIFNNDGDGIFTYKSTITTASGGMSLSACLGDLTGNGLLDVFIGNASLEEGLADRVYLNTGNFQFSDSEQGLGNFNTYGVALGDLNGDGTLDAVVATYTNHPNMIYYNNGSAIFSVGPILDYYWSYAVVLADIDGDGDLDIILANHGPNHVYLNKLNEGKGFVFSQELGNSVTRGMAVGDLNGDGHLDLFFANVKRGDQYGPENEIWLNNGQGIFTDSGLRLGSYSSGTVSLGDVNGNGRLDILVGNEDNEPPDEIWLNTTLMKGDLNRDRDIKLDDLIMALQVLCGLSSPGIVLEAAVFQGGPVGLADAVYILQILANLRERF